LFCVIFQPSYTSQHTIAFGACSDGKQGSEASAKARQTTNSSAQSQKAKSSADTALSQPAASPKASARTPASFTATARREPSTTASTPIVSQGVPGARRNSIAQRIDSSNTVSGQNIPSMQTAAVSIRSFTSLPMRVFQPSSYLLPHFFCNSGLWSKMIGLNGQRSLASNEWFDLRFSCLFESKSDHSRENQVLVFFACRLELTSSCTTGIA
jgi:hypothetical protein